jgi:hypothetical protein
MLADWNQTYRQQIEARDSKDAQANQNNPAATKLPEVHPLRDAQD